ncbi:ferritin-like domain-containing protein [Flavobacterium sp. MFBS3-15]|uniref:ferritin-like domain-containing protein n=1 Tax=Flavobacterium sp. MFBS3-15 TaxID=2989816 RepID=UPI00223658EB|nr:ferritin-like domain-containing protein [Flavobacterium sp. MFBS3-15]MCW4468661.1 ferritin-like domain-containing protein [Flavobacterium sp. MFBS3-15]
MNILKFIESFTNEGLIKSLGEKHSRRESFSQFGNIGKTAALAAAPFGLAALLAPTKARAASAAFFTTTVETPTQALQLALTLEYLEDEFYQIALDTNGLIPQADRAIIAQISQHEAAHVEFLRSALGDNAPDKPTFDFTGGQGNPGGPFNPFENYEVFLALSQAFEDTGVRAYKGQAGNLMSQPDLLQAALQIHSVEARHASQIRRLRGQKGWIEGNDRGGLPEAAQAVYDGEQNTMQAGFNTATVPNIPAGAGSESYDEPLTGTQASDIAGLFIV